MYHRGRKLMAWLLTASVALSGNSVTVLAGELDFSDVQVAEEQAATVAGTDENEDLVTEIPLQQEQAEVSAADEEEFGSEEVDLTMENEDTDETELETEDPADNETDAEIVVEEEDLFSAGDSEESNYENYYFPNDEVILPGWGRRVDRFYDGYLENADDQERTEIQTEVTNVSVVNAEDETDNTPVCIIEPADEDGWDIQSERPGTAVVTLTYKDINEEEKTYTYRLYVSTDKYTLEPQWGASEGRMLKNSTMETEVILWHQWIEDEEERDEKVNDWSLEFAPNEENWTYDQNILSKVEINNDEKKITVKSVTETGGTDILLKASIASEEGVLQKVVEDCIYVEVCDEYDVLYPEYMQNINVGDTLNLNETELGLQVKHVKENAEPVVRDDVTLEYDYDPNQWKDITEDELRPVLKRATTDRAWLDIRAIDAEDQEICNRHYEFEEIDCEVYFKNLRDDDYSTYFYDDEDGDLQLVTEGLDEDNIEIAWKVGYRKDDQEDEEDSFTEVSKFSEEYKFWSEKADDDYVLEINGEKLSAAYKWLGEEFDEEYWFEVRAHVMTNGIKVRTAQAGINTRKTRVEYYFPGDEVILPGWGHHVDASYNMHIENKDNPDGTDRGVDVTDMSVANAEDEKDDTPVCEIDKESSDENGWEIVAKRVGTAVVTLYYKDIAGEEQTHSYNLCVSGDKYTLEPQMTASCGRMLPDSEMKIPFVLRHEWRYSDEEEGSEEVKDWTLKFEPDQKGWTYDTNLLPKVEINGHEISITSGDGTWGTDILLKAVIPLEDGTYEDVTSGNIHIEVCNEYDVLYPENISNINLGDTLDLNTLGLKVEHINENGSTSARNDVTYEFEYDGENSWKNTAAEGQLPILTRVSTDGTWLNIIAIDEEGNELDRREYRFDWLDYSVWFDNLREDDYWTFIYKEENYEISVNKKNLTGLDASIKWNVVYRESGSEQVTEIPENLKFCSFDEDNNIIINGEELAKAQDTVSNYGYNWYEVQARVVVGETELNNYAAFGLEKVRSETIDSSMCFPVQNNQQVLMSETFWVPKEYNCWTEDKDHPFGGFVTEPITELKTTNAYAVQITEQEKGWVIKPLKTGKCSIGFSFKTPFGDDYKEFTFKFYEKAYWMDVSFDDGNNQMVPGETKLINVAVYYRSAENSEGVKLSPSEYTLTAESFDSNVTASVNNAKSQISLTARASNEPYIANIRVNVSLKEKYEYDENESVWYADDTFGISVAPTHDDVLALTHDIDETPEMGEAFDLNAYGPVLKRYDSNKKQWEEVEENVRIRLEYDEEIWTATEETKEDLIPVLIKSRKDYTVLRLVAEELVYNPKYGREEWIEAAERYIGIQDSMCAHEWKITEEKDATCGTDGKIHKKCTICAKEKDEVIPATGEHSYEWVIDKNASCSAEGSKHEECKICHVTGATESIEKTAHSYQWKTDAAATCGADGSRHEECKYCGSKGKTEKLSATGAHVLGEWTVTRAATAVAEGTRERHCIVCGGAKETGSVEKLKPSVTLNVPTSKKLPLKVKQSFQVKASDFATGDRVISWTSSNKKIVTVSGNGKITGKKAGQAVVTVTLQSGLSAKFTVKVQKTTVTTTSLLVVNKTTGAKLPKTVSMKAKQKLTLLTSVTPVTSKQKVTYSSSDKKIATVSSKGVITAKKKGTVTITVKSGKKSVKIKVKVTK